MRFILAVLAAVCLLTGSAQAAKQYRQDCKVLYIGVVDPETIKDLLIKIAATSCSYPDETATEIPLPELIVQSEGGSVEPAIVAFVEIKDKVCTRVSQSASSAAVLIALAGKQGCRTMHRDAFLMLHPMSFPSADEGPDAGVEGLSAERQGIIDRVKSRYARIISSRSNLTPTEVEEMMNEVTFLSATDALQKGLVDSIFD